MPPKRPTNAELRHIQDYKEFQGVVELVKKVTPKTLQAHQAYETGNNASRSVAEHILDMRRRIKSSVHGLPDLKGGSPAARSAYADMMSLTAGALGIDDPEELQTAMTRLQSAVRHYQRQVLIDYLRALRPGDPDTKAILGKQAHLATDENVTRMIYDAYERVGVKLPADKRHEVERRQRGTQNVIGPAEVVAQAKQLASSAGTMAQTVPVIRWENPAQARAVRKAISMARARLDELEEQFE